MSLFGSPGKKVRSKMLRSTYGTGLPATRERTPSSRVLADLLRQAPPDHFTLGWLLSTLHQRSFGVVILFLGILATAPIGSSVPGIMLAAVAVQMIAGVREPIFPRFITERRLPNSISDPSWRASRSDTAISGEGGSSTLAACF